MQKCIKNRKANLETWVANSNTPVFSIGHSTQTISNFLRKLKEYQIQILVDVRSIPYSGRYPQFNRQNLQSSLLQRNIQYIFKGNNLGGLRKNVDFNKAISEVCRLSKNKRVVLMCSEGDYHKCHRYNVLTPAFEKKGVSVFHIV